MSSEFISITNFNREEEKGSEEILDLSNLGKGINISKFAVCEKCIVKRGVDDKPFVRYYFRDKLGKMIVGREYGIEDLTSAHSIMTSMTGSIVRVTFDVSYFNGYYLKVNKVDLVSKNISDQIKDKFFRMYIDGFEAEIKFFNSVVNNLGMTANTMSVYNNFEVEFKLKEGYYFNVMEGLKGSPLRLVNTFSSIAISMCEKLEGRLQVAAYVFTEAILVEAKGSVIDVIKVLNKFKSIVEANIGPQINNIYNIVESTICLIFNLDKPIYDCKAVFPAHTREYVMKELETKSQLSRQIGIFEYDGKIMEKR